MLARLLRHERPPLPKHLRAGDDALAGLGAHGDDGMSMDVRPLAALGHFLGIVGRVVNGEDIAVPRKLLAQEIPDGILESGQVGAGAGRDDQVHDVPALAAVHLLAPVLLDKIARVFRRR